MLKLNTIQLVKNAYFLRVGSNIFFKNEIIDLALEPIPQKSSSDAHGRLVL